MATNKKIQTTELDFDGIKQSLKTYLQGQSQFTDYDFEGSSLSVLLDVLSYNTHYNALYTNLAINEAFLDSASKRSSVVSKAKELGYVPQSAKCSTAVVSLIVINDQLSAPAFIEIPRYAPFTTSVDGTSYTFYTTESYIAYRVDNQYQFTNVVLKEGQPLTYQFEVTDANSSFTIPNPSIDTSTLRVIVQENAQSSTYTTYNYSSSIINVDENSQVYFLKEIENQYYQLEFGNGVIGKQLSAGNIVTVEYMVGNQDGPNGARTFQYNGQLNSNSTSYVVTTTPAYAGSAPEDIEAIKWNAPRMYAAQNRCVTLDDYKSIIYSLYPNAETVNVWGGETNNPPTYGDVYISVKPTDSDLLSDGEKEYILNDVIGPRKMVTIHPKFVDPEYLHVEVNTSFYYDQRQTPLTPQDLTLQVSTAIQNYNATYLNKFNGVLKFSALSRAIDAANPSIVSNITTLKIHRDIEPQFNQLADYTIDLGNPIYNSGVPEQSIVTSGFNALNTSQVVYIEDLPTEGTDVGTLRMFYYTGSQKTYVKNVGTVTYSKGLIQIQSIIITGVASDTFKVIVKPQSNDIASARNQIVSITTDMTSVTPVLDTSSDNYKFTSSRN